MITPERIAAVEKVLWDRFEEATTPDEWDDAQRDITAMLKAWGAWELAHGDGYTPEAHDCGMCIAFNAILSKYESMEATDGTE